MSQQTKECDVRICDTTQYGRGNSRKHYVKYMKWGNPLGVYREHGSGHIIKSCGHKVIRVNGLPMYEHRYIMEKKLRRPLLTAEIIHHIDGNPSNNDIENLMIVNLISHRKIHARKYKRPCIICGKDEHCRQLCPKHYYQDRMNRLNATNKA